MSRYCPVTGKKVSRGYKYSIRGIAKKKKGIGLKVTGKTKRRFKPNLKKKKLWIPEEKRYTTLRVTTSGLRNIIKLGMDAVAKKLRAKGYRV